MEKLYPLFKKEPYQDFRSSRYYHMVQNPTGGHYTSNLGYQVLREEEDHPPPQWWYNIIWSLKCPLKLVLFMCLYLVDKVLVWKHLVKILGCGLGICSICKSDSESIDHLFIKCLYIIEMWRYSSRLKVFNLSGKAID